MPRPCAQSMRSADFVFIDALERHGVDLHLQTGGKRRVNAGQHLVEIAPARDGAELVGIQRVERNIDALDAVRLELGGVFFQLRGVGGEREFLEGPAREMARQRRNQRHDAAPHQRLAAGQAQLAHALGDERAAQPVEFLQAEQVGLRQERHVLRHAIDAAEIAAVGHRNAQIGDGAMKRVDQRARAVSRARRDQVWRCRWSLP